jgi:hypothetical protein
VFCRSNSYLPHSLMPRDKVHGECKRDTLTSCAKVVGFLTWPAHKGRLITLSDDPVFDDG